MKTIYQFFKLIRIDHWIKNGMIFIPVFFSGKIFDLSLNTISDLLILFFSFCLASSIIYIVNDLLDAQKDKNHPIKSQRPITSGFFKKKLVFIFILILSVTLILLFPFLKSTGWYIILYILLNLSYSLWLKKIPIVDVSCIGIGYILRIKGGGAMSGIFVSHWILIIMFFLTVSIAFSKRKDDLLLSQKYMYREVQKDYNIDFLKVAETISFSVTLITYILYTVSEDVIERIDSDKLYFTSIPVFIGIMRYIQLSIVEKKAGCPINILKKDTYLKTLIIIWFLIFTFILYGKSL